MVSDPVDADPPGGSGARIARCVVEVEPLHLDRLFDYRVGDDLDDPVRVGSRVEVVFSGRRRRALVAELTDHTEVAPARLRDVRRTFGPHVWVRPQELDLLRWAAARWGAPLADVVRHALPGRTVAVERSAERAGWFPPADHVERAPDSATTESAAHSTDGAWATYGEAGHALAEAATDGHGAHVWRPLPDEDTGGLLADLVLRTIAGGRDAVVVTPDGASRVARRLVDRCTEVLGADAVADVRGDASPRVGYRAWLRARCGQVRLLVGERGTAFWPVEHLGLAVVLDEANPALKERRSPRHHVREVMLERARRAGAVGLLVTTVPSAATWELLRERRLRPVVAPRDVERRHAPRIHVDDGTSGPKTRLGSRAVPALRRAVAAGRYGIVLAARGGQGTALVCAACGHRFRCPTCGSSIGADGTERTCRTCGWRERARGCPECRAREVVPLAAGAERIGTELRRAITQAPVAVLEGHDREPPAPPAVLVMTRGSVMDAPPGPVGAIVLPDIDALARRPEVDAPEDALRLAMALCSWAAGDDGVERGSEPGVERGSEPGVERGSERGVEVVVRTDEPGGAVVQALVRWDPGGFWRDEAPARAEVGFPPARHAVAVHADGDPDDLHAALAPHVPMLGLLGPVRTPEGLQRALCLVEDRAALLDAIRPWREDASHEGRTVRVDVDPVDFV